MAAIITCAATGVGTVTSGVEGALAGDTTGELRRDEGVLESCDRDGVMELLSTKVGRNTVGDEV